MTTPPLHPLATNSAEAQRARSLADWLTSDEYLAGHANIAVFDFYDLLADPVLGTLRPEFQRTEGEADSHPNALANRTVAPKLVTFIEAARAEYLKTAAGTQKEVGR
jgi:hypothetical protein